MSPELRENQQKLRKALFGGCPILTTHFDLSSFRASRLGHGPRFCRFEVAGGSKSPRSDPKLDARCSPKYGLNKGLIRVFWGSLLSLPPRFHDLYSCWCSGNEKWNDPYEPSLLRSFKGISGFIPSFPVVASELSWHGNPPKGAGRLRQRRPACVTQISFSLVTIEKQTAG